MLENILNGSWADRGVNYCWHNVVPKVNNYLAPRNQIEERTAKVWGRAMANAAVVALAGAMLLSAVFSFKAVVVVTMFNLTVLAVAALTHKAASTEGIRLGGIALPRHVEHID